MSREPVVQGSKVATSTPFQYNPIVQKPILAAPYYSLDKSVNEQAGWAFGV